MSSTQLFFSHQLFRDEINVEFKFRVLYFRVLFETLNFLDLSLSLQNSKARDSFDAKRARFSSRLFRGVRASSFEERRPKQQKSLSFVEIAFVKREASRFLSQSVYFSFATNAATTTLKKRACTRVFFKNARTRRTRRRRRFRLRKQRRL